MTMSPATPPDHQAGSVSRRVLGWYIVTAAVLAVVASFVYRSVTGLIDQGRWVEHTHEVLTALGETTAHIRGQEVAQRAYLLTGQRAYLDAYRAESARIPEGIDVLRRLTADNAGQRPRLDRLQARVEEELAEAEGVLATFERGGLAPAQEAIRSGGGRSRMDEVQVAVREVEAEERRLLLLRERAAEEAAWITLLVGGACLVTCLGALAMAFSLVRREWSRRRQAESFLQQSNADLETSLGELRELTRRVGLAAALGDYLQACRTPEEAYTLLSRKAPDLLPGVAGAIGITSHSRTLVETVLTWGGGAAFAPSFHPEECWGLRRGRPHRVEGDCDPTCGHLAGRATGQLCLPMSVQGETLGVLSLSTDRPEGLTERERHTAGLVAEKAALSLANIRLQEALRDRSIRDPLTGLYNRRYLEESLGREISRAERRGLPVAVVMADVDHFKRFNDTHGHEAGDAILAAVGTLLARHGRGEDIACRYGGEEFCLVLPGAGAEAARRRAEELREAVSRLDVRFGDGRLGPVTISAGVATYPESREGSLVGDADSALYRAKREGRDRAVLHGSGPGVEGQAACDPADVRALPAPASQNGHRDPSPRGR